MEKFVADVHLGKLARTLRLLGFDTSYKNSFTNEELVAIALEEDRVLLSRNEFLPKKNASLRFLHIQNEDPFQQAKQVVAALALANSFQPFSRCLICNGALNPVAKDPVLERLPPNTALYFEAFWQCTNCGRIYWKGAHYNRMLQLIERLKQ